MLHPQENEPIYGETPKRRHDDHAKFKLKLEIVGDLFIRQINK